MQGNYVKLLHPQARDLGERDGRGLCSNASSRKPHTDFHSMSGVLKPIRATRAARTRSSRTGGGTSRNRRNRPTVPTPGSDHPGERANAQLKTWRILRKLRCCLWRADQLAKAIHVLQTRCRPARHNPDGKDSVIKHDHGWPSRALRQPRSHRDQPAPRSQIWTLVPHGSALSLPSRVGNQSVWI
jgi:hypothetical protein